MGSDLYLEAEHLAKDNFWPARMLLERVVKHLEADGVDPVEGERLYLEIKALLQRTEQR